MTEQPQDRWQEIRGIHKEYRFFYQVGGGITLILIGILIGAALFADDPGYRTNLYTEILSISVTVFVLNLLAERREERRRMRDLQDQLIRDAASTSNEKAKDAVYQVRRYGWLTANDDLCLLKGAHLLGANLKDAHLWKANLTGANLRKANLAGADLGEANLAGANLRSANLVGADLRGTKFDANTVLPDSDYNQETGEYSIEWTPDTNMTRYTDPKHPDFWQPPDWMKERKNE